MNMLQTQCAEDEIDKTLASLKTRIGDTPTVQKERFVNWGKTQSMEVISSSPTTKEELQKLVLAASEEGLSVRCAGRGHSWAPLFSDSNQLLIHVKDMKSDYKDGSKIRISDVSVITQVYKKMYALKTLIRHTKSK